MVDRGGAGCILEGCFIKVSCGAVMSSCCYFIAIVGVDIRREGIGGYLVSVKLEGGNRLWISQQAVGNNNSRYKCRKSRRTLYIIL